MNLSNRHADTLILRGDMRVRVRERVRFSPLIRTRTRTRTLMSLQIRCVCPGGGAVPGGRSLQTSHQRQVDLPHFFGASDFMVGFRVDEWGLVNGIDDT